MKRPKTDDYKTFLGAIPKRSWVDYVDALEAYADYQEKQVEELKKEVNSFIPVQGIALYRKKL